MSKKTKIIGFLARHNALDEEVAEKIANVEMQEDGGPGSGNFGHAGRPGKKGGSAPRGGGGGATASTGSSGGGSLRQYIQALSRETGSAAKKKKLPWEGKKHKSWTRPDGRLDIEVGNNYFVHDPNNNKTFGPFNLENPHKIGSAPHKFDPNKVYNPSSTINPPSGNVRLTKEVDEADKWLSSVGPTYSDKAQLDKTIREIRSATSKKPSPEESRKLTEQMSSDISPILQESAVKKYKKALEDEPAITEELCDVAEKLGFGFIGLNKRLKSAGGKTAVKDGKEVRSCRIEDKIRGYMKEKDESGNFRTYDDAVNQLKDLVRYTMLCSHENLGDDANSVLSELEKRNFKVIKCKSTWDSFTRKNSYRGVNCSLVSPQGTVIELQFHTPVSYSRKGAMHPQYNIARNEKLPQEERDRANDIMYNVYKSMKMPRGLEKLKAREKKLEEQSATNKKPEA